MNRQDLIEELHRIKESIASLNDELYSIEDELIDSCGNNSGNMKKYICTCNDNLYAVNIKLTKAITALHINMVLYEK